MCWQQPTSNVQGSRGGSTAAERTRMPLLPTQFISPARAARRHRPESVISDWLEFVSCPLRTIKLAVVGLRASTCKRLRFIVDRKSREAQGIRHGPASTHSSSSRTCRRLLHTHTHTHNLCREDGEEIGVSCDKEKAKLTAAPKDKLLGQLALRG